MTDQQQQAAAALLDAALRTPEDDLPGILVFDGRDAYLAFVTVWKGRHAAQVSEIRRLKAIRRDKSESVATRNAAQERRQGHRGASHALQVIRRAGKDVARAARESRLAA